MSFVITDVIYDIETHRVIILKMNDTQVLPSWLNIAHYEKVEPALITDPNGDMYLKPNAIVLRNGTNFDEDDDYEQLEVYESFRN